MADAEGSVRPDGRSTRWVAHRHKRRSLLLSEAREVLSATGPDVAMDELAAAMGTSKSILYRYFEDRRGLRDALSQQVCDDITELIVDEELRGWRVEVTRGVIQLYLARVAREPDLYMFVVQPGLSHAQPQPRAGTERGTASAAVGGGDRRERLRIDFPFEYCTLSGLGEAFTEAHLLQQSAAVGCLRGATVTWLDSGGPRTGEYREELSGTLARWLTQGPLHPEAAG